MNDIKIMIWQFIGSCIAFWTLQDIYTEEIAYYISSVTMGIIIFLYCFVSFRNLKKGKLKWII